MSDITKADLRKEVRRMDPNLPSCSDAFRTAMLLLAIAVVGPDSTSLRTYTRFGQAFIRLRLARLRENGVVVGDKLACQWDEPDAGVVAFWLDVSVAQGLLRRSGVSPSQEAGKP